jgi:hypothetical protein
VKYQPLRDYLASLPKRKQDVTLRFAEIENIIGARLPRSASDYLAWWGNQDYGVQAPAWIGAGFVVDGVDLERKLVRFQRGNRTTKPRVEKKPPRAKARTDLPASVLIEAGFHLCGQWETSPAGGIRFLGDIPRDPGAYAHAVDGVGMYIGVATMGLKNRIYFYGKPGSTQRTSVRVNDLIAKELAKNRKVDLLVVVPGATEWNGLPVDLASGLEHGLIRKYLPPWNRRGVAG